MQVFTNKGLGKLVVIFLMLGLFLGLGSIMPAVAAADISVTVTGDGVTTPTTFTQAELAAMTQVQANYSSINTWPTKKTYVASGVRLADLLAAAGIKDEATLIKVKSTDGFSVTFTVPELLQDPRYYYPGLKDNHEYFGYIPGSAEGAAAVDTILALANAEGDNFANLRDKDAPILMMGQRYVTEQTNSAFAKYVSTIEVTTATPAKWESPVAAPGAGAVAAGTKAALSTSDMEGDSIHYTTDGSDPTFESPMYNWIKKRWWGSRSDDLATINHPIDVNQSMTIKAVAIGFGKEDSDIVSFAYQVPSTPAPVLVSAEVTTQGDVSLTFDKAMADPTGIGAEGQFEVIVDGQSREVSAVVKTNTATKIKLTLTAKVVGGQAVTAAYTKSGEASKQVKSSDGGALESFSAQTVTNNLALSTPPALTPDTTANTVGRAVALTFTDDAAWRAAITGITVDGTTIAGSYSVAAGQITLEAGVFTAAGDFAVIVKADGYQDAAVTQTMGVSKVTVTLNLSKTVAAVGESVTASGTAPPNDLVPIKVLDSAQNIIIFDAIMADANGNYSMNFIIPGGADGVLTVVAGPGSNVVNKTLTVQVKGDVNGDETVDIMDVVQSVNFILGKSTPSAAQLSAADCNGDGKIDVLDVMRMVNMILGKS